MTFEEWFDKRYGGLPDTGHIKEITKEAWMMGQKQNKRWGPYSKGAKRGFCNKGGCKDSFHVGGNYGSEVCYNPEHKNDKRRSI